jgi:hypothetical protein
MYVCMHINCTYVCMYICIFIAHTYVCIYVYINIYVYPYIYRYMCILIYMYMHTYTGIVGFGMPVQHQTAPPPPSGFQAMLPGQDEPSARCVPNVFLMCS